MMRVEFKGLAELSLDLHLFALLPLLKFNLIKKKQPKTNSGYPALRTLLFSGLYLYVLVVQTFIADNIKLRVYCLIGWGKSLFSIATSHIIVSITPRLDLIYNLINLVLCLFDKVSLLRSYLPGPLPNG